MNDDLFAFHSICFYLSFAKFVSRFCHFSSVAQPCLTLHDPMDCSMPDVPVHRQLQDVAQTHVR